MDTGGISPEERQRQTAAEIARKKVVTAYSQSMAGVLPVQQTPTPTVQPAAVNTQSYKSAATQMKTTQDWQQYHTAWQNYYQKYYSDYYSKAALQYVVGERNKLAAEAARERQAMQELLRQKAEEQKQQVLTSAINSGNLPPEAAQRVEDKLRLAVQKKAGSKFRMKKKYQRWMPIIAGVTVMLVVLFLQYNRLVFAPIMSYISPGNSTDDEIAAIDPTVTETPSPDPKLIIPKLNVNVPVAFGIANDTDTVNAAMDAGVAHFRIPGASSFPGQIGNTVITGHSAGDIYNSNQYKFIFSGLERLTEGDLVYVNYNSVRYTYKVTGKRTVDPSDVGSLVYTGDKPILTLLTCWPTGTTRYRMLVEAEQINPVPGGEAQTAPEVETKEPVEMPSNEKTFFERLWDWLTGK